MRVASDKTTRSFFVWISNNKQNSSSIMNHGRVKIHIYLCVWAHFHICGYRAHHHHLQTIHSEN